MFGQFHIHTPGRQFTVVKMKPHNVNRFSETYYDTVPHVLENSSMWLRRRNDEWLLRQVFTIGDQLVLATSITDEKIAVTLQGLGAGCPPWEPDNRFRQLVSYNLVRNHFPNTSDAYVDVVHLN
eukprot:c15977_g1_i2.p2 GENE.c15977_g1_i2~~c15977_g1_i2.p2  ORF type:complete len:124 (+),score=20.48 c15977_g1_i2:162-533(+)